MRSVLGGLFFGVCSFASVLVLLLADRNAFRSWAAIDECAGDREQ